MQYRDISCLNEKMYLNYFFYFNDNNNCEKIQVVLKIANWRDGLRTQGVLANEFWILVQPVQSVTGIEMNRNRITPGRIVKRIRHIMQRNSTHTTKHGLVHKGFPLGNLVSEIRRKNATGQSNNCNRVLFCGTGFVKAGTIRVAD